MPEEEKKKKTTRKKKATTKKATKKSPAKKSTKKKSSQKKKKKEEKKEEEVVAEEEHEEVEEEAEEPIVDEGDEDQGDDEDEEETERTEGKAPIIVGGPIKKEVEPEETEMADSEVLSDDTHDLVVEGEAADGDEGEESEDEDADADDQIHEDVVVADEIDVGQEAEDASVPEEQALAARIHSDAIVPASQKEKTFRTIFYIVLAITIGYFAYLAVAYGFAKENLRYEYQGDFFANQVIESEEEDVAVYVEILDTPTGFLRVRNEPSTAGEEVAKVFPGEDHVLVSQEGDWYEIELDENMTGWIFATYAEILSN